MSDVPGPALATLAREPFSRKGWLFERKLDGMRVLATREGDRVRLRSRSGASADASFPEVAEALTAEHTPDFVVDGEVVAFQGRQTSFARLQPRMHVSNADKARRSGLEIYYYIFDLLHLDGQSTRDLPLRDRKQLLRELFDWHDPLRYTTHRNSDGKRYYTLACSRGWEGVIAKRADAPYRSGRTTDWLKFKCELGQEFVIGGWTDPQGSRVGLGALLLGYYQRDGSLAYAGKVGTGFDRATLRRIAGRLKGIERSTSPFDTSTIPRRAAASNGVHWVQPTEVGEVRFTEWTRDGQLRHPRFLGLRVDKAARDVVREV